MIFGGIFCGFGIHLKNSLLFICGGSLGCLVTMLLLISFMVDDETPDSTIWTFVYLSLL